MIQCRFTKADSECSVGPRSRQITLRMVTGVLVVGVLDVFGRRPRGQVMRRRRFANLLITVGLFGLIIALLNAFSILPRDSAGARRRMQAISRVWHKLRGR